MSRRLKRVVLEYDDGMIEELTGENADSWMDEIVRICDFADRHGENPKWSQYEWQTIRKARPKD